MSCQHGEDACCQYCLEKVQTTTEDSPPEKVQTTTEDACRKKTLKLGSKKILILMHSSVIAVGGVLWYFNTKSFFNAANKAFDSILNIISTRTKEEEEEE